MSLGPTSCSSLTASQVPAPAQEEAVGNGQDSCSEEGKGRGASGPLLCISGLHMGHSLGQVVRTREPEDKQSCALVRRMDPSREEAEVKTGLMLPLGPRNQLALACVGGPLGSRSQALGREISLRLRMLSGAVLSTTPCLHVVALGLPLGPLAIPLYKLL